LIGTSHAYEFGFSCIFASRLAKMKESEDILGGETNADILYFQ
jgi:hypothetical protein